MNETGAAYDVGEIESYVADELGSEVRDTSVLDDGLNLNVAVSTPDAEYVLRRPRKLRESGLFLDLRAEFGVLERLREVDVVAPIPVAYCDDESVLGAPFFLATRLDGETIPLGSDLPERYRRERARRALAEGLVETLAGIHAVETEPFEGVCERLSPREQIDRAVRRLDEVTRATGDELATVRDVGEWLREAAPNDHRSTLVHGDFRPGNVLFAGEDAPEIIGVLDWETTMLGDPLTELGYLLLRWGSGPSPSIDEIEARFPDEESIARLRDANEHGLAPFTTKPGSPSRRELIARYAALTGSSVDREGFYRAHAAFMLATVWADLHRHRIETGTDSGWRPHVEYMSLIAREIAEESE